ncbi:unnamed protein product [Peniophora sp. CBMAI 1063]|nr:unnamed protein product [Peniophora sp. CBMAI 1063]
MAKKSRADEPPNPSSVANRDMLQRMNFLYQASAFLQTASLSLPQTSPKLKPALTSDGLNPAKPARASESNKRARKRSAESYGQNGSVCQAHSMPRMRCDTHSGSIVASTGSCVWPTC